MTQGALAEKLGINQSSVSLFAKGRNEPGPATCLALAGVCPSEDVAYWIEKSGLSAEAMASMSRALGVEVQAERMSGEERDVLLWWQQPSDAMGRSLRESVKVWLASHSSGSSQGNGMVIVPPVLIGIGAEQDYPESLDPRTHVLLEAILRSGISSFVTGIKANVESWGEVALNRGGDQQDGQASIDPAIEQQDHAQ